MNQEVEYFLRVMDFCFLIKMGKTIDKNIRKNLSVTYSQKHLNHAAKPATNALKTVFKSNLKDSRRNCCFGWK